MHGAARRIHPVPNFVIDRIKDVYAVHRNFMAIDVALKSSN
jgi:hypothetical protein